MFFGNNVWQKHVTNTPGYLGDRERYLLPYKNTNFTSHRLTIIPNSYFADVTMVVHFLKDGQSSTSKLLVSCLYTLAKHLMSLIQLLNATRDRVSFNMNIFI